MKHVGGPRTRTFGRAFMELLLCASSAIRRGLSFSGLRESWARKGAKMFDGPCVILHVETRK